MSDARGSLSLKVCNFQLAEVCNFRLELTATPGRLKPGLAGDCQSYFTELIICNEPRVKQGCFAGSDPRRILMESSHSGEEKNMPKLKRIRLEGFGPQDDPLCP